MLGGIASYEGTGTPGQAGSPLQEADAPDYSQPGPLTPARLPRLEHTCTSCFPACQGNECLLRVDAYYPKDGPRQGRQGPYPLAIITGGFLVPGAAYTSYAMRLASWGFVCITYDTVESVLTSLEDVLATQLLRDLINWAQRDPLLARLADTSRVYLCGHSRGGKVSVLAAVGDARVKAVCLLDPVDNTPYAPLAPGYPSAVSALEELAELDGALERPPLALAVVGAGVGGDCAPAASNYQRFFDAAAGPAWQLLVRGAGHFQFLDQQTALQRAVCAQGPASDAAVRQVSQAVMVAWGQTMLSNGPGSRTGGPADLPDLDQAHDLYATQAAAEKLLRLDVDGAGGSRQLQLESRLKNFQL